MPIHHIMELFALDGRDFVTEAYKNLLNREPDEHGLAYYLGRLSAGYGKAAVIAELAQSPECRPMDEIKGLKKLVADELRSRHWLWRLFGRHSRYDRVLQSILESLRSGMRIWAQEEQFVRRTQQVELMQSTPRTDSSTGNATVVVRHIRDLLPLDGELFIRAAYHSILGRAPDPQGLSHCLNALQNGTDKTVLIRGLALSPEAQGVAERLPGLDRWMAEIQLNAVSLPHQARKWLHCIMEAATVKMEV